MALALISLLLFVVALLCGIVWFRGNEEKIFCYHDQPCYCGKPKDPSFEYDWSL